MLSPDTQASLVRIAKKRLGLPFQLVDGHAALLLEELLPLLPPTAEQESLAGITALAAEKFDLALIEQGGYASISFEALVKILEAGVVRLRIPPRERPVVPRPVLQLAPRTLKPNTKPTIRAPREWAPLQLPAHMFPEAPKPKSPKPPKAPTIPRSLRNSTDYDVGPAILGLLGNGPMSAPEIADFLGIELHLVRNRLQLLRLEDVVLFTKRKYELRTSK